MKKVLLIAPEFNEYTEMFSRSIAKCGYDVKALSFTPYNWKTALLKKLHINQDRLIAREVDSFNRDILRCYDSYSPEFVVVIRGDFVNRTSLEKMSRSKIAIWLYDSITRYPKSAENWDLYDLHYVFEQSDIAELEKQGKKAVFLPLGYDETLYFPIEQENREVDISFVGAMYGNRKELLEHIARRFDNLKIEFYGPYVLKRDIFSYLRFLKSNYAKVFKNIRLSHEEANKLYAKSKININILHEQSKAGWNARLNEILGAGGFQLISYNDFVAHEYSGMLDTFTTEEELFEKIEYYLSHPSVRNDMRVKGYQCVVKNDTYTQRFKQIMSDLEKVV